MRRPLLMLLLTVAAGATGCVTPLNDDPAFSDGTLLESFQPLPSAPTYSKPDEVSVRTLDRSSWEVTEFTVPQRDTVHQPVYRSPPVALTHSSPVQRGEYPTAETAGENVTGDSGGAQVWESVLAPLQAVADVVLLIPRSIVTCPTSPVRGPTVPVERVPPRPPAVSKVADPTIPSVPPAPAAPALPEPKGESPVEPRP